MTPMIAVLITGNFPASFMSGLVPRLDSATTHVFCHIWKNNMTREKFGAVHGQGFLKAIQVDNVLADRTPAQLGLYSIYNVIQLQLYHAKKAGVVYDRVMIIQDGYMGDIVADVNRILQEDVTGTIYRNDTTDATMYAMSAAIYEHVVDYAYGHITQLLVNPDAVRHLDYRGVFRGMEQVTEMPDQQTPYLSQMSIPTFSLTLPEVGVEVSESGSTLYEGEFTLGTVLKQVSISSFIPFERI